MSSQSGVSHTILISATPTGPVVVVFEPVGGERVLAGGDHFRLEVAGPKDETLEIMHGPDHLTVWASPLLTVRVFDNAGNRLDILGY